MLPLRRAVVQRAGGLLVVVMCVALAAAAPASHAALPGAQLLSPLAGVPGNVNSADLNDDGRPDVVAPAFGTDLLAVRINAGGGSFGPIRRYEVGLKPSFIARADFNRDRRLDIAVSNAGSADVSVLLGNGDGTLRSARNYPISSGGLLGLSTGTFSLEAVDVDGDRLVDIVTSNSVTNDVSVLPGRGDGTFARARTYPIAGTSSVGGIPFALSLADFDDDGDADIITGGAYSVVVMRNDGTGRFTATSSYLDGLVTACTKVGDVNSDRILDAVATTWGASNARVLLGNGDGTFRGGQNLPSGGLVAECFSLDDLDGDRILDLAIASTSSTAVVGTVGVRIGHGDGQFGGGASATYPINVAPWATAVADYDGDGTVDIVAVNSLPPSFSLLRGNGDGTFGPARSYAL